MKDVLRLSLPLTLWLITFSALYGLHGMLCAFGETEAGPGRATFGRSVLTVTVIAAGLVQLLGLILLSTQRFGSHSGFVRTTSLANSATALVATVWTGVPLAFLPVCDARFEDLAFERSSGRLAIHSEEEHLIAALRCARSSVGWGKPMKNPFTPYRHQITNA